MTITINSVIYDAQSLRGKVNNGSNMVVCKNYEIGVLPEMDMVYVHAKRQNLILSTISVGFNPEKKDQVDSLSREEWIKYRKVLYSGGCVAVVVWTIPGKSCVIKVAQEVDAVSTYFKVEKMSLVSS
jgi:hypothetical protein